MTKPSELQAFLKRQTLDETDIEVLRERLSGAIMALGFIAFAEGGSHEKCKEFAEGILLSLKHAGHPDAPSTVDLLWNVQHPDSQMAAAREWRKMTQQ